MKKASKRKKKKKKQKDDEKEQNGRRGQDEKQAIKLLSAPRLICKLFSIIWGTYNPTSISKNAAEDFKIYVITWLMLTIMVTFTWKKGQLVNSMKMYMYQRTNVKIALLVYVYVFCGEV